MTIELGMLLFFGGIIACLVVIYIILVELRRRDRDYKKIALALNAQYQLQRFGKVGIIYGESSGKKFTIEDISIGYGEASNTVTTISVNCQNRGIPPLTIYGNFFTILNFPNWKYAFIRGKKMGFLAHIIPSIEERHKPLVQSLFQEIALLFNDNFKRKGWIEVKHDKIIFYKGNVIKNIEIIKQAIQLLVKIACRIESDLSL